MKTITDYEQAIIEIENDCFDLAEGAVVTVCISEVTDDSGGRMVCLTPKQAREAAEALREYADHADAHQVRIDAGPVPNKDRDE